MKHTKNMLEAMAMAEVEPMYRQLVESALTQARRVRGGGAAAEATLWACRPCIPLSLAGAATTHPPAPPTTGCVQVRQLATGAIEKAALTACIISADAIDAAAERAKAAVEGAKGAEIRAFFAKVGREGRALVWAGVGMPLAGGLEKRDEPRTSVCPGWATCALHPSQASQRARL